MGLTWLEPDRCTPDRLAWLTTVPTLAANHNGDDEFGQWGELLKMKGHT
jgi:hypothetical protein